MKPVFLIGFPGCGKSTLCRAVKRLTGIDAIDLDDVIAERAGMSIREYFAKFGEDSFRQLEHDCLVEASKRQDVLIACGGGVPCFFNNMDIMNAAGTTVWLDAPVNILFSRLARGRHKRPLIAAMDDNQLTEYITTNLKKRSEFYSKAQVRFSSALLETEQQIDETAERFLKTIKL